MRPPSMLPRAAKPRAWVRAAALPVALIAAAAPFAATPQASSAGPADRLTLTTADDGGTGRRALTASHARLYCHPSGGNHPHADDACAKLDTVDGDFTRLRHEPAMCTQEYAPVTAEARGTWQGRSISRTATYSNRCELSAHTGVVFDF
ncbi:MAG: protease inhibitor SIL-V5 [Streptosporangiales bacterium]|nr:protease inhibitor SIL-V5 [Streptosporangiales bacterium]